MSTSDEFTKALLHYTSTLLTVVNEHPDFADMVKSDPRVVEAFDSYTEEVRKSVRINMERRKELLYEQQKQAELARKGDQ